MSAAPLPNGQAVRKLLLDLLDRAVTVKDAPATPPPSGRIPLKEMGATAVFEFEDHTLAAVTVCDIAFAASTGAALTAVPPAVVASAVKTGKLPEGVAENVSEIHNIMSALFATASGRRVRLRECALAGGTVPKDASALLGDAKLQVGFDVTVTGYPVGKLSLVAATAAAKR